MVKYLTTVICKKCKNSGKVKKVSEHKTFYGYVCDRCHWYYSQPKLNKLYLNNKELKVK